MSASTNPLVTGVSQPGSPSALYAYNGTFASAPSASTLTSGTQVFFTDVGPSGSVFISTGSAYMPVNGRTMHARLRLPVFLAPTFTGTTNGAITFGTAFSAKLDKAFIYYPADSIVVGQAAGFYPTVMSSTTAAVVYNNVYTPAAGVNTDWPASPTAFSGAVPGGAGVTGSDITAFVVSLQGNILGEYGRYNATGNVEVNNTGGNKIPRMKLAGNIMCNGSLTTSVTSIINGFFRNCGATNIQRGSGVWTAASSANAVNVGTGVDTTTAQDIQFTLQLSAATDIVGYSSLCTFIEKAA